MHGKENKNKTILFRRRHYISICHDDERRRRQRDAENKRAAQASANLNRCNWAAPNFIEKKKHFAAVI